MRLSPIAVHILDYFRVSSRSRVDITELRTHCSTYGCGDLDTALGGLESDGLVRRVADGRDWLLLTGEGRRYAGLAAAESDERIDQRPRT